VTFIQRLEELAKLVGAWRSARCIDPAHGSMNDVECDGDNHVETCPVELARQNMIAAHNALGSPGMEK
jgi:hypothetical protein